MYNAAVEAKLKTGKKMATILPKKTQPEEYNQKLTVALKEVR